MDMTRFGWLVAFLVVVVAAVIAAFIIIGRHAVEQRPATVATSTPVTNPSAYSIYTSGTYGFTFFYPSSARLIDTLGTSTDPMEWRENAVATGTLVAEIRTSTGDARIGVSTAKKELAACTQKGSAETQLQSLMIGSTTWNVFSFDHIGTENETRVMSYRTLHDKQCFALETVEPLKVAASSSPPAPDAIIQSFTFAN